ncbi:MAG: FkbM family methyltransferase [Crocinitomicaceae bacterium]|nr:FkbM family methyltransferase [Crocinitomicaceae bacterium]
MKKVIQKDSNCIDIGCHKGEMLQSIIKLAHEGKHFAFEPIPYLYEQLKVKFEGQATVFPYALSDKNGQTTFNLVKNAPAYSGINKRKYAVENPEIEEIQVELKQLDEVIPAETKIDFIKIDVEGGEFDVLKGAKNLLNTHHPILVFECGIGASEFYGTKPSEIFQFLADLNYKTSTLRAYMQQGKPLTISEFENAFNKNTDYYFIAYA